MKKQTLLTLVLSIGLLIGGTNSANAQFGKLLKNAVKIYPVFYNSLYYPT